MNPKPRDEAREYDQFVRENRDVLDLLSRVWSDDPVGPDDPGLPLILSDEHRDDHPRTIGRFLIRRLLGQGGFGLVYLAFDPQLKREVALKLPRPEVVMTETLRQRFLREAELAASLDHAQIVPIFEAGQVGLISYIAAAWCDGPDLEAWHRQRQREGPLDPEEAARLMIGLAEAVHHAHLRGVIHRDLKPSNILVDRSARPAPGPAEPSATPADLPWLRITDFGLARSTHDAAKLTQSGAIVGTPAFVAPEQVDSALGPVTASVDLYALGAILYFLLSGRPPVAGDSVLETIKLVREQTPASLRADRPEIPRDLEAICLKCLEKEPRRRYGSASELAADLQRFLDGQPIVARRATPRDHLIRWTRRNPRFAASLAALGVVVPLGLAVSLALLVRSEHHRTLAEARGEQLRQEIEARDRALAGERAALADADREYGESRAAVDRYFVAVSEHQLLRAPGLKPLRQELLENAVDYYDKFTQRHQSDATLADELAQAHLRLARIRAEFGDLDDARTHFDQAEAMLKAKLATNPGSFEHRLTQAILHYEVADLDRRQGSLDDAWARLDRAIEEHEQLSGERLEDEQAIEHRRFLGRSLGRKANLLQRQGDLAGAEALHSESLSHFQALNERDPSKPEWRFQIAQALGNQAILARISGALDRSESLLNEVSAVFRDLADDHPENLVYQESLGKALANLSNHFATKGEPEHALAMAEDAIPLFDRLALIHPQVTSYAMFRASIRREAGMLLRTLSRLDEARDHLEASLAITEELGEPAPGSLPARERAILRQEYGSLLIALDDHESARTVLQQVVEELEADLERMPEDIFVTFYLALGLENLAIATGPTDASVGLLERGRALLEPLQARLPDDRNIQRARSAHHATSAQIHERRNELDQAIRHRELALQWADELSRSERENELAATRALIDLDL